MEGRPLTDTHRRQEGEEVVLLVVNDIPGVPLLPLLWVAEPDGAGTEVAHATAARPRAAPGRKRQAGLRRVNHSQSAPPSITIRHPPHI